MTASPGKLSVCGALAALAPVLVLAITACSGGSGPGGGFCVSDDPSISNLSLAPNSVVLGEGGGSVDVDVTFDYRTRDGTRILLLSFRLVDATGTRVINEAVDIADLGLRGSGTYSFGLPLPTQTAQNYRFRVRLIDECFSESNWVEVNFSVTEPAGILGKTDFGVARLNRVSYVIGGRDNSGAASSAVLRYDPNSGITTTQASMPEGRFSAAIATYNGLIFVFGGNAFGYAQDSTYVYNSATDSWTARAPMSHPVAGAQAFVIDGIIYVADDSHVDRYDPVIDSWSQLLVTSKPR